MKNLGKIILLFLMALPLFSQVKVSVDKDEVTRGERVTFTLRITGEGKVSVPPLDEICGYSIEGRMQSRKDVFSNGKRAQEISLMYEFMPQRSCVIEAFPVTINGREERTLPINITVSKVAISKNDPFIVTLETDKKSVYVGEPFEMKVNFQQRQNIDTLGESISLPESKNIWIKSEYKGQPFVKDRYATRSNMYALAAQQSGKLSLGPLRWDLKVRSQSRDYWGTWMATAKTRTVFSNELDIEVKPLPVGVSLVGDLEIEAKVDKTEVNAGEAVNVTINVKGRANVEDISAFEIYVDGAQAFKEEPKITHYLEEGKYFGSFVQKSALVAQRDFVIPAFELKYMDRESDRVKTVRSEPIAIRVLNAQPHSKEDLKISRPEKELSKTEDKAGTLNLVDGMLLVLGGFVLGLIVAWMPWRRLVLKEKGRASVSAKESKEVLQLLMTHMSGDVEVEELVKKLSENLYEGKSHPIDKKHLKAVVNRLQE